MKKGLSQIILGNQSRIADGVQLCREIGYEGLEILMTDGGELTPEAGEAEYREVRRFGEAAGIAFPSLCGGSRRGRSLTAEDPAERQQGIEMHTKLLEAAAGLGIDTVLTTGGGVSPAVPYDTALQRQLVVLQGATQQRLGVIDKLTTAFLGEPVADMVSHEENAHGGIEGNVHGKEGIMGLSAGGGIQRGGGSSDSNRTHGITHDQKAGISLALMEPGYAPWVANQLAGYVQLPEKVPAGNQQSRFGPAYREALNPDVLTVASWIQNKQLDAKLQRAESLNPEYGRQYRSVIPQAQSLLQKLDSGAPTDFPDRNQQPAPLTPGST